MAFDFLRSKMSKQKKAKKIAEKEVQPIEDTSTVVDTEIQEELPIESDLGEMTTPESAMDVTDKGQEEIIAEPEQQQKKTRLTWAQRLTGGLRKTRQKLGGQLATIVLGAKKLDKELIQKIENQLIAADVGVTTAEDIINRLTKKVARKNSDQAGVIYDTLKEVMVDILTENQARTLSLDEAIKQDHPFVILFVCVNGAGKTTSIAKIANHYKQQGKQLILAAGDTFRAAAVEQLVVWGERNQVRVVKQHTGADSASVIFDAMSAAKAKHTDIVLADTAGRLHTQSHLMAELAKIKKVMGKQDVHAPHETLLVVDATLGQNSLQQVKAFHEELGLTGICITKLDGSSKGGIVFAIAEQCQLPVRFIGVGEGMEDLQRFDPKAFVDALFDENE